MKKEFKYKYTTKQVDGHTELSEIDFELYDELFGKEWGEDDDFDPECIINTQYLDTHPIQIDKIIDQLQEFKRQGANYIAIDYHCDHIGYLLEGLVIEMATDEEINEFYEKSLKKRHKNQKKEELLKQLKELENES